jgi:hypothetical protein
MSRGRAQPSLERHRRARRTAWLIGSRHAEIVSNEALEPYPPYGGRRVCSGSYNCFRRTQNLLIPVGNMGMLDPRRHRSGSSAKTTAVNGGLLVRRQKRCWLALATLVWCGCAAALNPELTIKSCTTRTGARARARLCAARRHARADERRLSVDRKPERAVSIRRNCVRARRTRSSH